MSENLIAILINASIALIAVATLIYQRIYNRRLMDYNFHPIFKLYRFCNRENTHWTPDSCDGSNPISKHTCTKDHWFDVVNESTGIAFNVKVSLITGMEIASKLKLDDYNKRVQRTQALLKDGMLQYALPNDAIPFSCYQSKTSDIYFVIIEYKTVNGLKSYVQIVQLAVRPYSKDLTITDWKRSIVLFNPTVVSLLELNWYHHKTRRITKALIEAKSLAI